MGFLIKGYVVEHRQQKFNRLMIMALIKMPSGDFFCKTRIVSGHPLPLRLAPRVIAASEEWSPVQLNCFCCHLNLARI
ncbi:hypothetical protein D3C76_1712110 [compost metagenome]